MRVRLQAFFRSLKQAAARRPLITFFVLLALLLAIIMLGHISRKPVVTKEARQTEAKETGVFVPGENLAFLAMPATVKKERVMTITALSPGIVSAVYATPGKPVSSGTTLLEITSDYGSNRSSLSVKLSQEEFRLTQELADVDKDIQELEERRIKRDNTLSSLEEEIALRELKRERELRRSSLETGRLEVELARRNDAALKPKSLVQGMVESLHVQPGDYVTPGTALVTLRADHGTLMLESYVSIETASLVDRTHPAHITLNNQNGEKLEALPIYLAQTENRNGLFSFVYALPESAENAVTDGSLVRLSLPLRAITNETVLVPIDLLFQESDRAWLLVAHEGRAESREVRIERLYGSFAQVSGLSPDARIIKNRGVLAGEAISIR